VFFFFTGAQGTTIADYNFRAVGFLLLIQDLPQGTRELVSISRTTVQQRLDFPIPALFYWEIAIQGSTYIGSIFFSGSDKILGTGFGEPTLVAARQEMWNYYYVAMTYIVDGPNLSVYMAFEEGDEFSIEATSVVFWDFSDLKLPLSERVEPEALFVFADFIIALTRVKHEVYAGFQQPEIENYTSWVPSEWSPTEGLTVGFSFLDGTKEGQIEAVFRAIVGTMQVWIQRECRYRDFLTCDEFVITMSSNQGQKRSIERVAVFQVNHGVTFGPSLWISIFLCLFSVCGLGR